MVSWFEGVRSVNGFDWTLAAIVAASLLVGCGGGDSPANSSADSTVQQARELAVTGIERRAGLQPLITPAGDEGLYLLQKDQQLTNATAPYVLQNRYSNTLNRLAARASIARVSAYVVSDLACTSVPFGGGVTADRVLVLDGKLLDLLADVANGFALQQSGRLVSTTEQIVDSAARLQLGFASFCRASDPKAYPNSLLSAAEADRSVELFTQLVGGIFFHEFGHVWGWHALIGLRDQLLFPGGGFFSYTSALEDNADIISGILSAKSGHAAEIPKMTLDLMAFVYFYRQSPGSISFSNVETWNAQYTQTAPTYSSLTVRKN